MKKCGGVTLIELVAAMVISAIVVTLASRIYLSGHREFLTRVQESDRLSEMILVKNFLQKNLRRDVSRCTGGKLWLKGDSAEIEIAAFLQTRFKDVDSLTFRCYEADNERHLLLDWSARFQPQLVEYHMVLINSNKRDWLSGSYLK